MEILSIPSLKKLLLLALIINTLIVMRPLFLTVCFLAAISARAQVKILFDATKAETAGQADWIIDADQWNLNWNPGPVVGTNNWHSNAQAIPTPAQSGITATTTEDYWTGGISAWGVDCAKQGYVVNTLPHTAQLTYGNAANPYDLSNYKVYIVCEPNILFTTAEKTAIMQFVQNGGGLFMVADHDQSDRNGDGVDAPAVWNDLLTNNSVQTNPFGIAFDLQDFSGTSTSVVASPTDSIIHGPMGNVTEVKWSSGTSMTINPTANSSVKAVVYKTGTNSGNNNVLFAYARYGNGKVAAIGDSSPCDDGTGNPSPNLTALYDGYFTDANGNHQKLLMNATIWLATSNPSVTAVITPAGNTTICQGGNVVLNTNTGTNYTYQWKLNGTNIPTATNASYTATVAGNYTVAINGGAASAPVTVVVNPLPTPVIAMNAGVLTVTTGPYSNYQWYQNNTLIFGATNASYTLSQSGSYKVKVTDGNGCMGFSTAFNFAPTNVQEVVGQRPQILPNPTSGAIQIAGLERGFIRVYNLQGSLMQEMKIGSELSISTCSAGLYFVHVFDEAGQLLVVEKLIRD